MYFSVAMSIVNYLLENMSDGLLKEVHGLAKDLLHYKDIQTWYNRQSIFSSY